MTQTPYSQIVDVFLAEQFSTPIHNFEFVLTEQIKRCHQDMQLLCVDAQSPFPLEEYLSAQKVDVTFKDKHRVHALDHAIDHPVNTLRIGAMYFNWSGTHFTVYKHMWPELVYGVRTMYSILFKAAGEDKAKNDKAGENLVSAVFDWHGSLKDEIFVYSQGNWLKDAAMWKATQLANWNNLVLDPDFITKLKRDTATFFASREVYKSLDIPWKRGILLLGPTGNGKTESIKVLLKESQVPALYVKSLESAGGSEYAIRYIFELARRKAPCVLVLEDLDTLVTPYSRSYFLNELDGLDSNEGILTIATSNHPERIDDALLNRPSRFDVKYMFELPTLELRKRYITKWFVKVQDLNGIEFSDKWFTNYLAEETAGFSFAFMKELFVSFLLRVAHDKTLGIDTSDSEAIMRSQLKQLLVQVEMGEKESKATGEGNSS